MKNWRLYLFLILSISACKTQEINLTSFAVDQKWEKKIYRLAPSSTVAPITKKHKVLLFSLHTGFEHWVIPHADVVIQTLANKTGAYSVTASRDIKMFQADELSNFDAVILNNNCSIGPKRDLFYDVIKADSTLSEDEVIKKADKLEQYLLEFVKNGGGLAVIHGAIVMQNNSKEVSNMIGGSFDYHPRQQSIEVKVVDEKHPISSAFKHGIFKHYDEPYFFKNAYANKNFRPLLYMSNEKIMEKRHQPKDDKSYISWIKKYGKGRVFYVSPSHNAQSYEDKELLQFYLNGIQYVLGDLVCDDSPLSSS